MAEAAVEDRSSMTRFFCHKCSLVFISSESQNYICPVCLGGFIEEYEGPVHPEDDTRTLPELEDVNEFHTTLPSQQSGSALGEVMNLTDFLTLVGGSMDNSPIPPATGRPMRPRSTNPRGRRYAHHIYGRRLGSRVTRLGGETIRPSFENLITDVVLNLTGQGFLGGPTGNQMFIVGNPADYAWGREGLDTIVTQLLNQMDGTGPPPMPKERIVEIPTVPVTEEQVSQKLQCSVCWEDFQLGEPVRSLPCCHVYHEACICPWLELHATCPICRKSLTEEAADAANNSSYTVSNGLAELFRQQSIQQQLDGTHDNLGDTIPMTTGTTTSQSQSQQQSAAAQTTNPSNTVVVTASAGPSHSGSTSTGWLARPNQTNARPSRSNPQGYVDAALRHPGGLFADVELDMDIDFDFD